MSASAPTEALPTGQAHVATVSFLASRAAPTGGFWIALAGGVALARAAQQRGARQGFGASVAAMLESVAIMGPARFGVPLTQALTAPLVGRLEARGVGLTSQALACALVRVLLNAAGTAFFIWVVTGGVDAYAGGYDVVARPFGFEVTPTAALVATGAAIVAWAGFASVVQVWVYRRGLRSWPQSLAPELAGEAPVPPAGRRPGRYDPRAVSVAAAIAFALLLTTTAWPLLAAVAAWLALAWASSRPDREALPTGLALTAVVAAGSFVFVLGGGLGLELALRRAGRAALLVLVATWLRAAAGASGLREVSRRALGRLDRVPALPEAAHVLDEIGSEGRLAAAGRSLLGSLSDARKRPLPILDAVLSWVGRESAGFRAAPPAAPRRLALRAPDAALAAAVALLPVAALAAPL